MHFLEFSLSILPIHPLTNSLTHVLTDYKFLSSLNKPLLLLSLCSSGAESELRCRCAVFCCLLFYCQSEQPAIGYKSLHSERMWAQLSLWNVNICMLCVPSARPLQLKEGLRKKGEGKASCQNGWETELTEVLADTQAWLGGTLQSRFFFTVTSL